MKNLYLLFICWLFSLKIFAQDCTNIQISSSSLESRCTSTGSITVSVTSGSGSYSYKVNGPVTTPFTSSNIITGLQPGSYTVTVKDVTYNCTRTLNNVIVGGTYQDPRFQLTKT
ncbi:MAG: hypothetical protein ABR503_12290, partial [Chitinophagaceae bacterium]